MIAEHGCHWCGVLPGDDHSPGCDRVLNGQGPEQLNVNVGWWLGFLVLVAGLITLVALGLGNS